MSRLLSFRDKCMNRKYVTVSCTSTAMRFLLSRARTKGFICSIFEPVPSTRISAQITGYRSDHELSIFSFLFLISYITQDEYKTKTMLYIF